MNEFLRPATLGEILDRTANLYRSRFLVLFGIASVPSAILIGFMGCMVLLFAWVGTSGPEAGLLVGVVLVLASLVLLPLITGAQSLSGAALCHAAGGLVYGEKVTIREAFRAAWRRGWRYLGLYLLLLLIIFVAPSFVWSMFFGVVTAVAMTAGQGGGGVLVGLFTILLVLGLAVYGFWMLTRLCLAFPIAVIEQAPVTIALKRAASLSRGTRWRILVLFLLGLVLGWVGSLMVMVPLFLGLALVPGLNTPAHSQTIGAIAIVGVYGAWFVIQALTMPVYAIALVLFYYDQRVRQEGFDIEILMRQAGMDVEPPVLAEAISEEAGAATVSEPPSGAGPVAGPVATYPAGPEAAAVESAPSVMEEAGMGSAVPSPLVSQPGEEQP
jgi:hypothetical protein